MLRQIPKKEQTLEMCTVAINQNIRALQYASQKHIDAKTCLEAVKEDGNLFRYVPNRFKIKEMCWLAVNSNVNLLNKVPEELKTKEICLFSLTKELRTLAYTPKEIIYEILNEDASKELLRGVVELNIEWLEYMPVCKNGIDISLEYIKNDFSVCHYLSNGIKQSREILDYQKSQGKISIHRKVYDSEERVFKAEVEIVYGTEIDTWNNRLTGNSYTIMAPFKDFDEFYSFLDGDLYEAKLHTCKFEGINLKEYNIKGAIIYHDVLEEQGLFDGSYFEELKKRIECIDSNEANKYEICIHKEINYPKPIDEDEYEYERYDNSQIPFFYISDIHLIHRVLNMFEDKATKEEIKYYIELLVIEMLSSIGTIPANSYLLIAGDTSSEFELAKIFYEKLVHYWKPENIVVIHGNHELWDPYDEIESNIEAYHEYFKRLGITFLHNNLLLVKNCSEKLILTENEILALNENEIRYLAQGCSIAILGGIGFSALNDKYNAINLRYGKSFEIGNKTIEDVLKKEKDETSKFDTIYRKLIQAIPDNKVIVLTHMQKWDWNEESHNSKWIYINGHNHLNYFDISNEKVVYADNQIGYNTKTLGLKYFYIDNEYDIFTYLEDGIHETTMSQYIDFNKGKLVQMSFKRDEGQIYTIKKNGNYMFFIYCSYMKKSKNKYLYLLNGGKLLKVERNRIDDLEYYYDNFDKYVENINKLLDRYTINQNKISDFIKELGGSGKIHGCIVDVEKPGHFEPYSYCHLFVNPIDGKVTPYFANDVKSRIVYKDLKSLLESEKSCKTLRHNYRICEKEMKLTIPVIKYSNQLEEFGYKDLIHDKGSYIYKISRIIRSLQYTTENNIIRIWNENLLNYDFVNSIEKASRIEDMVNDTLIVNIDNV